MSTIVKQFTAVETKPIKVRAKFKIDSKFSSKINLFLLFFFRTEPSKDEQLAAIHKYVLISITVVLLSLICISVLLTFLQNLKLDKKVTNFSLFFFLRDNFSFNLFK